MTKPNKHTKSKPDYASFIKPYMWKKGQSGNVLGRPKGKTMKEYAKEYLARLTDEERDEWLEGINKDTIWEMAEGKADTKADLQLGGNIEVTITKYNDKPTV